MIFFLFATQLSVFLWFSRRPARLRTSIITLLHTELEDLATSLHHRSHQTKTTNLFCHQRPNPHHVNWTWSSSFETALLRTLCRTFSWGPKTDLGLGQYVCLHLYTFDQEPSLQVVKELIWGIKNRTTEISKNHILEIVYVSELNSTSSLGRKLTKD